MACQRKPCMDHISKIQFTYIESILQFLLLLPRFDHKILCLNLQNIAIFQHFKNLIDIRRQGEPRHIMRCINPKEVRTLFIDTVFSPLKIVWLLYKFNVIIIVHFTNTFNEVLYTSKNFIIYKCIMYNHHTSNQCLQVLCNSLPTSFLPKEQ